MKKLIALVLSLILCLSCAALAEAQQEALASTMISNASGAMLDNIDKAIAAINGKTIQPGVPFSFNQTVGPRTAEAGYGMAANGNGYQKLGGGVSQVATTLHNALAQLPLGTKVQAKAAPSAGFIEVIYNGMTGFIGENYLVER